MAPKRRATQVAPATPGGEYAARLGTDRGKTEAMDQLDNTENSLSAVQRMQEYKAIGLVMMPEEFPTLLYADSFASEKMCKKGILQSQQATWATAAEADTRWLRPDEYVSLLDVYITNVFPRYFFTSHRGNGSIWRRMHCYQVNPNKDAVRFRLKHSKNRTDPSGPADFLKLQAGGQYFDFNIADCDPNSGGSALAKAWNSSTMVCGRSKDSNSDARWVLINAVEAAEAGKETSVTITPAIAIVADCTITAIAWNGGEPKNVGIFAFAVGDTAEKTLQLEGPIGKPDFYTFKYEGADTDTANNFDGLGGFQIDVESFCSGLTQTPVDSAYQNIFQLGRITIIAASCRITCMAGPLVIQGESCVTQTRDPQVWFNWYTAGGNGTGSILDLMASYRDRYLGQAKNGGYAWHMPFRKTQFELEQCCELDYDKNIIKDVWCVF